MIVNSNNENNNKNKTNINITEEQISGLQTLHQARPPTAGLKRRAREKRGYNPCTSPKKGQVFDVAFGTHQLWKKKKNFRRIFRESQMYRTERDAVSEWRTERTETCRDLFLSHGFESEKLRCVKA
ncbi:hypothetical protein PoB_001282900 [Plakobranchus ocellatus]|uniref:Uncharacterized protein n=1 Tax=Plakobranchus ocellatus TaxID=259542 RepID=A0AAV3YTC9_9GAST|nr:hypothetical protein PoB_001282900 [Plakobranchus ocellatus]